MPSKRRYQELLEGIRDAHAAHAAAFQKARSTLGNSGKAYEATDQLAAALFDKLKFFHMTVLGPLAEPFLAGAPEAINEVLNFLEVDVPAFRTGYSKEWYYRKLKKMKLDPEQAERLKVIALQRCSSTEYRREDSELRRLMIRLADLEFLKKMTELPDDPNPYVRRKKLLMVQVILKGRKDLQKQIEAMAEPPQL